MKEEMCCTVFTGQRTVELQRLPIPEVDDDRSLVKIGAYGVYTWEQRMPTGSINTNYPLTGGCEMAG